MQFITVSYILNYNMKRCVKMSKKRIIHVYYIPFRYYISNILHFLTRLEQNDNAFYVLCIMFLYISIS